MSSQKTLVTLQKNLESFKMGILIFIIVAIVIVGGIWLYQSLIEGYSSGSTYARLGESYDTQLFSPCVSKRCPGGPYTFTSNPYLQSLCQGVSNEEMSQVACGKGFHGRPVHFDYSGFNKSESPISALRKNMNKCSKNLQYGAWDNALCDTPSPTSLCVL
jgi:hypothetical protein